MNANYPEILTAALALPLAERSELVDQLVGSLGGLQEKPAGVWSEDDPGFGAELDRRMEEYKKDPATGIDAGEAIRRIRAKLANQSAEKTT